MNKQQNKRIWDWNPKPRSVIIVGILLFLLVVLVHGHTEYQITASLARDTANTLRQQCISFYKQRWTRGYKRYKETSGLIEWKECQIFHSIFT